MVGKMISTLRSFACAQDDVKFARHPELGATHVDTCVNVGDICNDYLKSFSVSINVDNRLRNKCAMTCFFVFLQYLSSRIYSAIFKHIKICSKYSPLPYERCWGLVT